VPVWVDASLVDPNLGLELLDRLWEANDLDEADALALAVDAQHRTRG